MIITQTPMRITLGGGGTDILWYSSKRGGAWISAGIDKYVFVFLHQAEDKSFLKVVDGTDVYIGDDYTNLPNPIIKECLKMTKIRSGIEIFSASDASGRSGLGGSGAFEVGLLHALYTHKRQPVSQWQLGKEAAAIEIEKLHKPVGPQDQLIAALGGIHYFEMDKRGEVSASPIQISLSTIAELESNLLFFKTGIQRDTATVLGDVKQKTTKKTSREASFKALDEIKALGQQVKTYLETGKTDEIGASFHTHWLIKKQLSNKISNPQIDEWYNEAMKAGALGGKIMGAGGGGWFVFYVNKNKPKFRERMKQIGLSERNVHFDWQGSKLLMNLS